MNAPTNTVYEVCQVTGLTYRQIDYWMRSGFIWTQCMSTPGSGNHRWFTVDETNDLAAVAEVIKAARAYGMTVHGNTISQIWSALERGETWSIHLDVHRPVAVSA